MWKTIYQIAIIAGITLMVFLYVMAFDNFSETELVRLAYLWMPLIFFGIAGYIFHKKGRESLWVAIGTALFFEFWLIFFFEAIFPGL